MNYGVFKDTTIKLLNMYSASGNLTPISDSSVQDAALRFPVFANIAQLEIATTAKYILKTVSFPQVASTTIVYNEYSLPADVFKICKVEANSKLASWELTGRFTLRVLASLTGDIKVFYNAYPTTVPLVPADSFIFDLDEEACQALPYYCAAHVLLDDPINKSVGTNLYAIYQGKLANLDNITKSNMSIKNTMYTIPTQYVTNFPEL